MGFPSALDLLCFLLHHLVWLLALADLCVVLFIQLRAALGLPCASSELKQAVWEYVVCRGVRNKRERRKTYYDAVRHFPAYSCLQTVVVNVSESSCSF